MGHRPQMFMPVFRGRWRSSVLRRKDFLEPIFPLCVCGRIGRRQKRQPAADGQCERPIHDCEGTCWGSSLPRPGYIIRLDPGRNPPDTALAEIYGVPAPGYGIRGMDVDRHGVVWVPLDSGHIASFDRRKCKGPLTGPGAEKGDKCPEGRTFYPLPGPPLEGDSGAAENPYYVWVDQHNILGLGADTPIATGNLSDSLHALVGRRVIELRVPYPMGFFAKQIDGRIDGPNASWKGRGLWVTSGNRTPVHIEGLDAPVPGAPGTTLKTQSSPLVVEFQLRPDPLAH